MPFSHHSHSGQFCPGHAKDSLEEVIQTAIKKKMQVFCLTEHMPREAVDFYPEEVCSPSNLPSFRHQAKLPRQLTEQLNLFSSLPLHRID